MCRTFRQLFGVPDYERYVAHMAQHHPERPQVTEREFHAMATDRRFGGGRPRCC